MPNPFTIKKPVQPVEEVTPLEEIRQEIEPESVQAPEGQEEENGMEDFFSTTVEDLDAFDDHAWHKGEGYKLPHFPEMEAKLEGMEGGMYLWAAESNVGKSAAMMNVIYDACTYPENKLFGIYYSLDDSKNEIIPRVIAMDQSIPISVVSKPHRYQKLIDESAEGSSVYEEMLEKRNEGLQKLRNYNNMFKIEDGNKIKSAEDLHKHMKQVQVYVKSLDPDANIIVAIDSANDIKFSTQAFGNTVDKHSEIARTIKDWAVELNIPIHASCHLRKINASRRPTLDDLKESIEYVYESSVVFLLYNDVSKNKQGAKLYYNQEGVEGKCPVLEIDWAKNKKSSFKGRTYCYFAPEYSKITECNKDAMRRYDALIYEG